MRGINEFIIEIKEAYKDKITTEGGLEIYANKDFSYAQLSNRIGKVIGSPELFESEIREGYEVLVDPSILYEQIYRSLKQESVYLVDREKGWYRIDPTIIVMYRENSKSEWKGYLNNLLVDRIEKEKVESKIIFTEETTQKFEKGKAIVKFSNKELELLGVKNNDTIHYDHQIGISFWLENKEYFWIRNNHVLAKYE